MYNSQMVMVTITEARATLPHLVDRVLAGEEVTLTRHGLPVAVVVRPDALAVRRAEAALKSAANVHDILEEARRKSLTPKPTVTTKRAAALVAEVAASRSR
jgi:prevent-host-death family protein